MTQSYLSTRTGERAQKNVYTSDEDAWGNKCDDKDDGVIQIVMENVNNIPSHKNSNLKLDDGKKWLIKHEVDVACWIETGVLWHQRRRPERLQELMRKQL